MLFQWYIYAINRVILAIHIKLHFHKILNAKQNSNRNSYEDINITPRYLLLEDFRDFQLF